MDHLPHLRTVLDQPPASVVHSDPEIMGGTPVFIGTRVPLQNLIDYLADEHSIAEFLDDFPTVRPEQIDVVLNALRAAEESTNGA